MPTKLFIVQPRNERLYTALSSALANELDVEILYDRRHGASGMPPGGVDRRAQSDVSERIERDGFAVIRLTTPPKASQNIRWA
jgi:hypothetical protein